MQTRWYATRLRGRPAIIGGGIATRGHHSRENHAIRTGHHLQAGMHHHRVPECVLLYGQHRRSEGEDAVIIFFFLYRYAAVFVRGHPPLFSNSRKNKYHRVTVYIYCCYYIAAVILPLFLQRVR